MRLLTKLRARADAAYDNAHHAKLRGRLWGALDGTDYDDSHDTDEPPGFCFSLVFPPREMSEGDERWLLVAAPEEGTSFRRTLVGLKLRRPRTGRAGRDR